MMKKKGLIVLSIFLGVLVVFMAGVFSASSSPKCEEEIQTPCCGESASGTEICYLFGNDSIEVSSEGNVYDISLENIDDNGAEFNVNGESTDYLGFEEKDEAGGLVIKAGEVEYDPEVEANVIIFDYNVTSLQDSSDSEEKKRPGFFQRIGNWFKCLFSSEC